jgi:3-methyladenine DNA glycosylase AlkD
MAWRRRQRKHDCQILWPTLVAGAEGDVRWAQNAMLMHAMSDAAWREEMDEVEIYRVIAALTASEFADSKSPSTGPAPSRGS